MHAVAAGVGAELVVREREREARLGDLYAAELDAAGGLALARGLPAVAGYGGAAARRGVEHVPDERTTRRRIPPLDRGPEASPPACEGRLGTGRRQRPDDRLGNLLRAAVGGGRHRGPRGGVSAPAPRAGH